MCPDDPLRCPRRPTTYTETQFLIVPWQVCVVLLLYISANMMSVSEVSLMCKAQWGDRCFTIEGYFKTATAIAGCIAAPIAGLLVDWFGPRTSLCISICSSAVPAFVFLMSNSI